MVNTPTGQPKVNNEQAKNTPTSAVEKNTKADIANTLKEAEEISKEFKTQFGANPSKESALQKLKQLDVHKDVKNFDEAMQILKEGKDPEKNNISGKHINLYQWLKTNILSEDKIEEKSENWDFANIYGEHPTEESVLQTLKKRQSVYQEAKTYPEAMEILAKRRPPAYKWIKEHIQSGPTKKTDAVEKKINTQEKKVNIEDKKQVEDPKNQEAINKEMKERGYKIDTPQEEAERLAKHAEADRKEKEAKTKQGKIKKAKKDRHIWKNTGKAIARPFQKTRQATKRTGKTLRNGTKKTADFSWKSVKTIGKTAWTPVGLLSYLLADIGIKDKSKRTGWKDRRAGYKKIWEEKEKK